MLKSLVCASYQAQLRGKIRGGDGGTRDTGITRRDRKSKGLVCSFKNKMKSKVQKTESEVVSIFSSLLATVQEILQRFVRICHLEFQQKRKIRMLSNFHYSRQNLHWKSFTRLLRDH